jgi:hypothetical protein
MGLKQHFLTLVEHTYFDIIQYLNINKHIQKIKITKSYFDKQTAWYSTAVGSYDTWYYYNIIIILNNIGPIKYTAVPGVYWILFYTL